MLTLQAVAPVSAGALAAGLHARPGKPLRWFGRRDEGSPWQLLKSDTSGEFSEFAACLLLADRGGRGDARMIERFIALVGDLAAAQGATFDAPDAADEAARAEALDRICADLDVQIGLTLLKPEPATIAGTRLRGVAEAAGFRLADAGRFDWVQDETGAVLYSLQNYRSEPFTADTLRVTSTTGRRVPARRAARRRSGARLRPDEARRQADDADARRDARRRQPAPARRRGARGDPRSRCEATATALREVHIEPGSPRALALFGG